MIQNPSTQADRSSKKQAGTGGFLKRDINLLPANENSDRIARHGTVLLAVFVGLLLLGYFAFIMPSMWLNDQNSKTANAMNQLSIGKSADVEFTSRIDRRNALNAMNNILVSYEKDYLHQADLFAMVTPACPDNVTLLSLTNSRDGMTLLGRAASDGDIAQFLVNLKAIPDFSVVELGGVQEDDKDIPSTQKRLFEIKADWANTALAGQTENPSMEGGDGK